MNDIYQKLILLKKYALLTTNDPFVYMCQLIDFEYSFEIVIFSNY